MKKSTHYSKSTVWSFFIGMIICSIALFVIDHINDKQMSGQNGQSPFIEVMEAVQQEIIQTATISPVIAKAVPVEKTDFLYLEVIDGCGIHFDESECLNVRSGPGTNYPVVTSLRSNIVLKVANIVENEEGKWYEIIFDEWLRYPNRVADNWYISAEYVRTFSDIGTEELDYADSAPTMTKRIIVDRLQQTLIAYEEDEIYLEATISSGLDLSPTPAGIFQVFKKTPTRYMQGPIPNIPGSDYYDLPGVPWNLYFTEQGAVIHGAYWHDSFGSKYSHGCVNLSPDVAEQLYHWADLGTVVEVRN